MQWVLIRGIVSEKYHWGSFMSLMKKHFPQHHIQTADIVGNGHTRNKLTPLSLQKNIQGLRNQVNHDGKKILFGFSLGGMLALEWAYAHPNEVEAVILINSSLNNAPYNKRLRPSALKRIVRLGLLRNQFLKEELVLKMTTTNLDPHQINSIAQDWGAYNINNPIKPLNFFLQLGVAAQVKLREQPPTVPILLLSSEKDQVVHPDCSSLIAEKWELEHLTHPHAGHDLTLEDPHWVLEKIESWIKNWKAMHPPQDLNSELSPQSKRQQ